MLTLDLAKIDKFVIVLTITLTVMATIVTFAFKGIFSAYLTAYEINQGIDSDLQIEKGKLEQAYEWVFSKETIPLQMSFSHITIENEEN